MFCVNTRFSGTKACLSCSMTKLSWNMRPGKKCNLLSLESPNTKMEKEQKQQSGKNNSNKRYIQRKCILNVTCYESFTVNIWYTVEHGTPNSSAVTLTAVLNHVNRLHKHFCLIFFQPSMRVSVRECLDCVFHINASRHLDLSEQILTMNRTSPGHYIIQRGYYFMENFS